MSDQAPILHMLCGKIASGKSTLAARLAQSPGTVLISEDEWLAALFASEMQSPKDYVRCAVRLRDIMGPHIAAILGANTSVVLDFQANTRDSRNWMRSLLETTGADHRLHLLNPPDDVCLARLRARNASGKHPFSVSDEQFRQISKHFDPPSSDEGFNVVLYEQAP
ncbi:MAG: ATP-binding protein [Pseudomonadota bacterium]